MAKGDIDLSKTTINKCFEPPWTTKDGEEVDPNQGIPFERLWRLVFPEWDRIDHIDRWPSIGRETANYIMERFIAFDKAYHPEVMAGGLWMNSGFSSTDMEEWFVDRSTCTIHYKEGLE